MKIECQIVEPKGTWKSNSNIRFCRALWVWPFNIRFFKSLWGENLLLFFQAPRAANNGSGIGQLLRDPDHYEEINVIGNGESLKRTVMMMMMMVMMVTLSKHFMGKTLWVHCNDWHLCNLWSFYTHLLPNCIIYTPFVCCQPFAPIPLICSVVKWCHLMTYDCQSCVCVFVIDTSLEAGAIWQKSKKASGVLFVCQSLAPGQLAPVFLTDNMQKPELTWHLGNGTMELVTDLYI